MSRAQFAACLLVGAAVALFALPAGPSPGTGAQPQGLKPAPQPAQPLKAAGRPGLPAAFRGCAGWGAGLSPWGWAPVPGEGPAGRANRATAAPTSRQAANCALDMGRLLYGFVSPRPRSGGEGS